MQSRFQYLWNKVVNKKIWNTNCIDISDEFATKHFAIKVKISTVNFYVKAVTAITRKINLSIMINTLVRKINF